MRPQTPPAAPKLHSLIVSSFPLLFNEFRGKRFVLLWRGSRDGFGARGLHGRCDGQANTLILIFDMDGNVFGCLMPLKWDSSDKYKCDDSLQSFLYTLKNPQNIPGENFTLNAKLKQYAILCHPSDGPLFAGRADIHMSDNCDTNTHSYTSVGMADTDDTGLDDEIVLMGSKNFQVREIQVFEIKD
jgi:hypothetical protein